MRSTGLFALVALALISETTFSRAAPNAGDVAGTSADAPDEARDSYRKGVQAFGAGRYQEAIRFFHRADELRPSAALEFNVGKAYEKLGEDGLALAAYRSFLRRAAPGDDTTGVSERIRALETHLMLKGVQQVTLLSTPPGATVSLDGRELGRAPWTGELPPGKHSIALALEGYAPFKGSFALPADHAIDVSVTLELPPLTPVPDPAPVAAAPPPAPAAPFRDEPAPPRRAEPGHPLRTWGFITAGAGIAALGGAVTFELLRRSSERDAEGETRQIQYAEHVHAAQREQLAARILGGSAIALGATAGLLFVLDANDRGSEGARRVGLGCAGGGCGVQAVGSF